MGGAITLDGEMLRRGFGVANGKSATLTVSVWAAANRDCWVKPQAIGARPGTARRDGKPRGWRTAPRHGRHVYRPMPSPETADSH
jgi:hypothetical protein